MTVSPSVSVSPSLTPTVTPSTTTTVSVSPTTLSYDYMNLAARVLVPVQLSGRMACHPTVSTVISTPTSNVLSALRREAMYFFGLQGIQAQVRSITNCGGNTSYFGYTDPINNPSAPLMGGRRLVSDAMHDRLTRMEREDIEAIKRWQQQQREEQQHLRAVSGSGAISGGWARQAAATVCPAASGQYAGAMQVIVAVHVDDYQAAAISRYIKAQVNATTLNATGGAGGNGAVISAATAAMVNSSNINPCAYNATGVNVSALLPLPDLSGSLPTPFGSTFMRYLRAKLYQADTTGSLVAGVTASITLAEMTTTPQTFIYKMSAMEKVLMYLGIGTGILAVMVCILIVVFRMRCLSYCKPNKRISKKQIAREKAAIAERQKALQEQVTAERIAKGLPTVEEERAAALAREKAAAQSRNESETLEEFIGKITDTRGVTVAVVPTSAGAAQGVGAGADPTAYHGPKMIPSSSRRLGGASRRNVAKQAISPGAHASGGGRGQGARSVRTLNTGN